MAKLVLVRFYPDELEALADMIRRPTVKCAMGLTMGSARGNTAIRRAINAVERSRDEARAVQARERAQREGVKLGVMKYAGGV